MLARTDMLNEDMFVIGRLGTLGTLVSSDARLRFDSCRHTYPGVNALSSCPTLSASGVLGIFENIGVRLPTLSLKNRLRFALL